MRSRKQLLWAALGLILSLCISFGLCMIVYGEDESVWDFDTEYWAVNDYTGAGGDVVVPEKIKDCPVNVLKLSVFNGNADITSLTLPEGLELMQESDCSWLDNLTSIEHL